MNNIIEKIVKYKYLSVIIGSLIFVSSIMILDYCSRIKTNKKTQQEERKKKLDNKIFNCLDEESSIFIGLGCIKKIEKVVKQDIYDSQLDIHVETNYKYLEDNNIEVNTNEFRILNPELFSTKDEKYGFPVSLSYQFNFDKNDTLLRKRLRVKYSSDTILTLDFYTNLLKHFINYKFAMKQFDKYDKKVDDYYKKKQKEQNAERKRRKYEEKKTENQNKGNQIEANKSISLNKFTYLSTYYDIEGANGTITNTVNEVTYHIFDLQNKLITQLSQVNGEWVKLNYRIQSFYTEGIITKNNVFVINSMGIKEIWINPGIGNLGYDYIDGRRVACYGIKKTD